MAESHLFEAEAAFLHMWQNKQSSGSCHNQENATIWNSDLGTLSVFYRFSLEIKIKRVHCSGYLVRTGSATTSCYMWLYTAQLAAVILEKDISATTINVFHWHEFGLQFYYLYKGTTWCTTLCVSNSASFAYCWPKGESWPTLPVALALC